MFGYHSHCLNNDLCDYEKSDINADPKIKIEIIQELVLVFKRLENILNRVYSNISTNLAENYHSIRCKLDAHKSRNYI